VELFHYSEEPDIRTFVPRPPPARAPGLPGSASPVPDDARVVWAIDARNSPLYLFPRDCPRIMFWPLDRTSLADRERWLGTSRATKVAAIEWEWLSRMHSTLLFRYTFDAGPFSKLEGANASPGTWLSEQTVVPTRVDPVGDLLDALRKADVELRLLPSLTALKAVWDSTLHASGVRLRNAKDWLAP
jgi:hypothetical protein